ALADCEALFRVREPNKRMRDKARTPAGRYAALASLERCVNAGERASRVLEAGAQHDRPAGALKERSRTMFALVVVLLNALSFASLAYVANRKGYHTMAALARREHGCLRDRRRADLGKS